MPRLINTKSKMHWLTLYTYTTLSMLQIHIIFKD